MFTRLPFERESPLEGYGEQQFEFLAIIGNEDH
jgi:hypothetical protein